MTYNARREDLVACANDLFAVVTGGHVRIQSEPGRGTTVTLYLPRDLSDGEAEPAPARVAVEGAQAGESILVVEDEPSVREIIVSVLAELGYAYAEAGDAESALVLLDGPRRFDLLVSDVGLPGLNGRQLAFRDLHFQRVARIEAAQRDERLQLRTL